MRKIGLKIFILIFGTSFFIQGILPVQAYHKNIDDLMEDVTPSNGISLDVKWGDLLSKLRDSGAINLQILNNSMYEFRGYGLTMEEYTPFNNSSESININSDNKIFLLNIFGALGLTNNNTILDGHLHMLENRSSPVGDAKYNSATILEFNSEQQALVEDIALHSYRPCCNASALVPDCSHAYATLGLIEFLVFKQISRDDIFGILFTFNSYWFADQYLDVALFVEEQGQSWNQVNSTQIMGYSYSSLEAYETIKKYLVENGYYDPISENYVQDPYLKYSQMIILILLAIFITSSSALTWLLLKR
jgi:hypothetical protein